MAKTAIHEQTEALSVYFRDMLAEPEKTQPLPADIETHESPVADEPSITQAPETTSEPIKDEATPNFVEKQNFLLCEIGGMSLAVAVSTLNNIVHWPEQGLTQLPGQSNWQLGLLRGREQHCTVFDIHQILQAPNTSMDSAADYILLLDVGQHGIACNAIEQIRTINTDDVNWRQDRSQRPWFLGVLSESMHSIVDLEALIAALENGEMA